MTITELYKQLENKDFQDHETPVITVILFLGILTLTFFKLCSLAPLITIFLIIFFVALS